MRFRILRLIPIPLAVLTIVGLTAYLAEIGIVDPREVTTYYLVEGGLGAIFWLLDIYRMGIGETTEQEKTRLEEYLRRHNQHLIDDSIERSEINLDGENDVFLGIPQTSTPVYVSGRAYRAFLPPPSYENVRSHLQSLPIWKIVDDAVNRHERRNVLSNRLNIELGQEIQKWYDSEKISEIIRQPTHKDELIQRIVYDVRNILRNPDSLQTRAEEVLIGDYGLNVSEKQRQSLKQNVAQIVRTINYRKEDQEIKTEEDEVDKDMIAFMPERDKLVGKARSNTYLRIGGSCPDCDRQLRQHYKMTGLEI